MTKLIRYLPLVLIAAFLVVIVRAQAPTGPPKPGPEHEKLAFFVGKWSTEGEAKPTSFGPGGKYTATETCDWFNGKFAVVCKTDGIMMGGAYHDINVLSYDSYEKTYVYFETNNWGETIFSRGSFNGDTWTWTNDTPMAGKVIHGRFILKQTSPDAASYTFEMASGSDPMTLVMQGKQSRQK